MYYLYLLIIVNISQKIYQISCTIDVNLSQLEYLASHMDTFECRRLIAALHYKTYDLPESLAGAIRKLDESTSCLHHLLHWNSSPTEGKGQTHEHLQHRLRQINRIDLADWLGKSVFKELSNDLNNILNNPFGGLEVQNTQTQYSIVIEPTEEPNEENPWLPIDTLLTTVLVISLACLLFLILATAIDKIKKICKWRKNNDETHCKRENQLEKLHTREEDNLLDTDDNSE